MKTCARCGHSNKDEAKFCGACGNKFEAVEPASTGVQESLRTWMAGVPPDVPEAHAAIAEPLAASTGEASKPQEGLTCGHCGTVIRYCPCCGKPLGQ